MPGTKEELLKTIDTIDCTYDILAGGTDLYAKEKTPFNGADAAIDISGIKEFSVIKLKKEDRMKKNSKYGRMYRFCDMQRFISRISRSERWQLSEVMWQIPRLPEIRLLR